MTVLRALRQRFPTCGVQAYRVKQKPWSSPCRCHDFSHRLPTNRRQPSFRRVHPELQAQAQRAVLTEAKSSPRKLVIVPVYFPIGCTAEPGGHNVLGIDKEGGRVEG